MTPAPALTFGLDQPHGPHLRAAALRLKASAPDSADRVEAFEAWVDALGSTCVYHRLPPGAIYMPSYAAALFGNKAAAISILRKLAEKGEARWLATAAAVKAVRDLPRDLRPNAFFEAVKGHYACLLDQNGKEQATPGRRDLLRILGICFGLSPSDAERLVDDAIALAECEWHARHTGYDPITTPTPDLAPDTVVTGSPKPVEVVDAVAR